LSIPSISTGIYGFPITRAAPIALAAARDALTADGHPVSHVRVAEILHGLRYSLQGVVLIPLFVVAVRYPTWAPIRFLNNRWVRFCGVLSYAIYLVHPTVIWTVQQRTTLHPIVQGAIALAVTMLLALGIHVFIERPFATLRRRLAKVHRSGADGSRAAARQERTAEGGLALLVPATGEPSSTTAPPQLT